MIRSMPHSLSTTIMLVQYRWDTVRAFETSSYILTVCCKTSRFGLSAALITKQREKQEQKWELCLPIQRVLYKLLEHCWYRTACKSVCVCSGVNICIASLCLHGCFCFLCLYKLVLKAGTSHLWSCESLKFHPSTPHCQQSTAVHSKSKWINQVWLEGKQCCFALLWAFSLVLWRTQFSRALCFQTVCFYWRLLADLKIKLYLNALLNRGLSSTA